jgi:hypothetical protein
MAISSRRTFVASVAATLLAIALPAAAQAQATMTPRNRALFQVTDNDPARWPTCCRRSATCRPASSR